MENNNRNEISKQYFRYLKHLSTISTYFILFLIGIRVFKFSKYTAAASRLTIPFVISCVIALALMAGLFFYNDLTTFIERHRRIFEISFFASAILCIFGLVNAVVFFIQH